MISPAPFALTTTMPPTTDASTVPVVRSSGSSPTPPGGQLFRLTSPFFLDTAVEIIRTLRALQSSARDGASLRVIEDAAKARLEASGFVLDYAEVRRADLTRPKSAQEPGLLALVAARLGRTRLIDNLPFDEE